MTSDPYRRRTDETGAVLLIALVIVVVIGLIVGALLSQSQVHIKNAAVVANHQSKVYAADAGVQYGIDAVRVNQTLCPSANATPTAVGSITINAPTPNGGTTSRNVDVTCQASHGSSTGVGGWGVITTSGAPDSLVLQSGQRKSISGSVFVSGDITWGPGLEMQSGDFVRKPSGASCPAPPSIDQSPNSPSGSSANLFFDARPPNDYFCSPTYTIPNIPHPSPALPTGAQPAPTTSGVCTVFAPGHYTTPPALVGGPPNINYFASGVYYFDNIGSWSVTSARILGGTPTTSDLPTQKFGDTFGDGQGTLGSTTYKTQSNRFTAADVGNYIWGDAIPQGTTITAFTNQKQVTLSQPAIVSGNSQSFTVIRRPACASDTGVPGAGGTGVEFIFGGNSSMVINTQGQVELFTRTGNAPSSTDGFSFLQLDPTNVPAGGTVSTVTTDSPRILNMNSGATPDIAMHGIIYTGIGAVTLNATNTVIAEVLGGVVSTKLTMQSSASAAGLLVSTDVNNLKPRQIVITSTAKGVTSGDRDVKSVAIVTIANDAQSTTTIASWRTSYIND